MQTRHLKLAERNKRPRIMMCSKPCRYLFTDLICYSSSDLLIAAFSVHSGFVIVAVLWLFVWTNYGWSSWEYTGLFRCLLLIYWFLSSLFALRIGARVSSRVRASTRTCLSKTDGDAWLCLCVGNESISFTLVSLPSRGGRVGAASCIGCLFASSFILSQFSHICSWHSVFIVLCLICLILSHWLSLPLSPASQPIVFVCQSSHGRTYCSCSPYLCFLLFCLFLSHEHSILPRLTLSAPASSGSILLFSLCEIRKTILGKVAQIEAWQWWHIFSLVFGVMTQYPNCWHFREAKTWHKCK